jgi:16S rRNA (guanine(1405)-N(7))-methyltransferase
MVKGDNANEEKKQLDQLVSAVLKSPKYKNASEDLIKHVGMRELLKEHRLKAAIKATKNKLHQIGGAYFLKKPKYSLWLEELKEAKETGNEDSLRKICFKIMGYHYSTRERLKILDDFYKRIFAPLPPVQSIMDVACGYNPLSIPWMPISAEVKYYAYDVYKDMIDFISKFMAICNIQGHAEVRDVIQNTPQVNVDVAFVLNTIPCFEQIEKSAGMKVLESINSKFLVASFPVKSLCGREKSMRKHYENMFNKLTKEKSWTVQQLEFRSELVFLITK